MGEMRPPLGREMGETGREIEGERSSGARVLGERHCVLLGYEVLYWGFVLFGLFVVFLWAFWFGGPQVFLIWITSQFGHLGLNFFVTFIC